MKHGLWFSYGEYQNIVNAEHFEHGILNGSFEKYYKQGNIEQKGYYKNGFFDSVLTVYYKNGRIMSESNYFNGKLNGLMMYYDKEGNLSSKEMYIDGNLDTNYNDSYENPNVITDNISLEIKNKFDTVVTIVDEWNTDYSIYRNDSLISIVNYFEGNILIETYFNKGIVSKRIYYQKKNPAKLERIVYFEGEQFPRIEEFDKNGDLIK
tara:strand:+ start:1493 stop:2116 length:624 start_codon:yes stop_codon:yes gene_type:complete